MGNEQRRIEDRGPIVMRRDLMLPDAYVAPRTATGRKLAEIWRRALGMDQVGITDDFEELGGDSLLAVSMFVEIEAAFAIAVPVRSLARAPTIEQLALRIDELVAKK